MTKLSLLFTLTAVSLPIAAQNRVLVPQGRFPISTSDQFSGGVAYPTACDEQGRPYIKVLKSGPGMVGPIFRLSSRGIVEAQFDTSDELTNRYAVRPDGGVIMIHVDGKYKVLDNFAPDGARQPFVRLEPTPIAFFPSQLAVFHSGEIFVSGLQYHPGYKA